MLSLTFKKVSVALKMYI